MLSCLFSLMNGGDKCHQRKKMMCRGSDGGCGTKERPGHSKKIQETDKLSDVVITELPSAPASSLNVDTFSQARKALCERGPYDVPEDSNGSNSNNLSVSTLPTLLANLLKHVDSKKKHKKSHSVANKKSSSKQGDKAKGKNIWDETEVYFRDLALPDIDTLHEISTFSSLADKKCFLIPCVKNETNESTVCRDSENVTINSGDGNEFVENTESKEKDNEQPMEIDSTGVRDDEDSCAISDSERGLEWILGSRTRTLLTSERPTKKRKLLGSGAGLEKLLIGSPCHENSSLCHYCCKGDFGLESNRLIVCSSCQSAVHQKCYGVQGLVDGPWLCSWCKEQNNSDDPVKQPCVFCPKTGGALKPVHESGENCGAVEFAHLFCSLLMPEVYIDDLTKMEPIKNVEGIKKTQKKLICNICKVKCGARVRCTNGACRTSFHPLCAREASHRVEVWGKYGCDKIELRAFCSKHSSVQNSSRGRDKEVPKNDVKVDQLVMGGSDNLNEGSDLVADEKNMINLDGFQGSLAKDLPKTGGGAGQLEGADPQLESHKNVDQEYSVAPSVSPIIPDLRETEAFSNNNVHPSVHEKLLQRESGVLLNDRSHEFDGNKELGSELDEIREGETSILEASSNASICCDPHSNNAKCKDEDHKHRVDLEQLIKARKTGVLELSAQDEVEGEIIYFQHMLLSNEAARKQLIDNLVYKVSQNLPKEINEARGQRWDGVLVNQYLHDLREAKKQGRKERKHKEAQADLATKRAAAAASSRISSFRKDALENTHQEISLNSSNGRVSMSSQLIPRPKVTLSKVAGPRISSEKYSEFVQPVSEFSKDHPKTCDICRRLETLLNPILVCYGCKVAVHLDCYRSVNESSGPWYCELCEELSSRNNSAPSVNFWENPYFIAECFLCGGSTGAFRKSCDEQWVHAFCAEWVFETTFRRGQVNPVEGLETACRGVDSCCVCRRKNGICIRCNHGHCQTRFHPTCARSAGFYMSVKANDGKLKHKAYCEKHSIEPRAKGETPKHGLEELKTMKQFRVELERLRLLCERIVKREKLKRELVISSHNILACKRDQIACSVAVHSPALPDASSESATTSLKGHTDGYRSRSDARQQSDGVTVDSIFSVKLRKKIPDTMDSDQKTDDSSTSQNLVTRKPTERKQFAGKQIPNGPFLGRNLSDDGEWSSQFRKSEVLMTSDQASVKNQRLVARGFAYVPIDAISKEKQMHQEACSDEPMDQDQ